MRTAIIALALTACAAPQADAPPPAVPVPAVAPAPPPVVFPDEPFRAHQPPPAQARAFAAPHVQQFTLPDGIEATLVERHNLPIVSLSLDMYGGASLDPKGKDGLASVCTSLMSEGTQKLDKLAFEEALADLASEVSSGAAVDRHQVSMSSLRKNLDATLDLWTDTLLRPGLRQDELDRSLKRRIAGLAQLKGSPAGVAPRLAGSIVFGPQHLHGRMATEGSYRALTLADCQKFVATRIKPRGAKLFVVGDITRAELESKLAARLGGWSGRAPAPPQPAAAHPRKGKLFFVDIPKAAQSMVVVLASGPQRKAPDFHPTSLMAGILGGGFTSRINMNIREKHGYAYGAGGGFVYTRDGSHFRATASVRTNVTKESIQEILKEVRAMASGEPTDEELSREKDGRVLALPARFATGEQTLGAFRELVYYGLPLDYFDSYVAQITAVNQAAVKKAAARHLHPAELQILVVGDGKVVLPGLEELVTAKEVPGPIVKLDADGKSLGADTVASALPARERRARLDGSE
jgi:zinc protease